VTVRTRALALAVLALVALASALRAPADAASLAATRTLAARLRAQGRGEARLEQRRLDALGGAPEIVQGTLALEPPDRVRLDFPATGERVTLRGDGGEWLQPALRQLVEVSADDVAPAVHLWDVLLRGRAETLRERRAGAGVYVLEPGGDGDEPFDSVRVTLGATGLPARIVVHQPGGDRLEYRFSSWRFVRPRGAAAFRLATPPGFTRVRLGGDR